MAGRVYRNETCETVVALLELTPYKLLDPSGGGVFRNLIPPAMLE
jgi:hypothetical protein